MVDAELIDLTPKNAVASVIPLLVRDGEYKFQVPSSWMMALLDGRISKEGLFVAMNYNRIVDLYGSFPTIDELAAAPESFVSDETIRKGITDLMEARAARWFKRSNDEPRYIVYLDSFS